MAPDGFVLAARRGCGGRPSLYVVLGVAARKTKSLGDWKYIG